MHEGRWLTMTAYDSEKECMMADGGNLDDYEDLSDCYEEDGGIDERREPLLYPCQRCCQPDQPAYVELDRHLAADGDDGDRVAMMNGDSADKPLVLHTSSSLLCSSSVNFVDTTR